MSGTSSNTCFFSFGPDGSFISKSFEGLRYHDISSTLLNLLISGTVLDIHWASLGPTPTSWLLSFKDSSSKHNLAWGPSIPSRLEKILSKLTPSPHLRVFLGPDASYIAWDPTFIRWSDLPERLEDSLQSWLTPSGWRAGPPRMVTWGVADAFFAMSEYGDVAYRMGNKSRDDWSIWRETVEEWKGETGFRWSEIAYVALDPTTADQFVAIRNDGTWSGSIADEGSVAMEAFAHNFFRRISKPKPKEDSRTNSGSPPRPNERNGQEGAYSNGSSSLPADPTAFDSAAMQAAYTQWSESTALLFASALAAATPAAATPTPSKRAPKKLQIRSQSSPSALPPSKASTPPSSHLPRATLFTSFPYIPAAIATCALPVCTLQKVEPGSLRACKHDVEKFLRASGSYGYEWLRQERLRWHPDRFGRLCAEEWRDEGRKVAEEMFKMIDILITEVEGSKGREGEK